MGGSRSERDEFGRIVAKMAVAQICESVGFHSLQASAIETLADIAIRYLRDLAKAAHYYSNLACRIESNAFDVILAMEDVGPVGAAADANRPISRSSALREVMRFVEYGDEVPFSRPLPRFPVAKKRSAAPSFAQLGEAPPGSHIPSWLPALPDPHTYRCTPVWPDRKRDPAANRLEQARQRRKAETSLLALHSRLSSSLYSKEQQQQQQQQQQQNQQQQIRKSDGSGDESAKNNAFLMPALEPGAKEVSPVVFGGFLKDGSSSIVEAFASVIDTANDAPGLELQEGTSGLAIEEEQQRNKALPDSSNRSRVVLSFDFGSKIGEKGSFANKILGMDRQQQNQGAATSKRPKLTIVSSAAPASAPAAPAKEEDMDERKKRAEQILHQAMDNAAAL